MKRSESIKFLSIIMSIVLLCAVFVPCAYAANQPKIVASSAEASAGDTVDITISLENNPGIVSATLNVEYNADILTLTNVTDAGVLGGTTHKPEFISPYTLAWANDTATQNYTVNGTIATLTFKVDENAETGKTYPITISYNSENYDIYNKDLNPVSFGVENGKIAIVDSAASEAGSSETGSGKIIGDANGNGRIDAQDVLFIRRYNASLSVPATFDADAADVNRNGKVDAQDVLFMRRYNASQSIPSTIKIGQKIS